MKQYQHYINGAWTDPDSGEWFDTENPYTGEVWAKIARGNAADMDRAVAAAKQAFEGGWGTSLPVIAASCSAVWPISLIGKLTG